jgi:hypothetical protein
MQRRKGALSPTTSGCRNDDLPTPQNNGGGTLPQVDNDNNNKGHVRKDYRLFSLPSFVSHGMVAIVVFVFATTPTSLKHNNNLPSDLLTTASLYLPQYCPTNIIEYIDRYGYRLTDERRDAPLHHRGHPPTGASKMTPVPSQHRKTFYYDGDEISQPIARALRSRGWQQVDSEENAHLIYTYSNYAELAATLQPWQRFNYIPGYRKWNKKDTFAYYYKKWEAQHKDRSPSVYVPETYLLTESEEEIQAFAKVLQNGGSKYPWVHKEANVNQGRVSRYVCEGEG